LEPSKAEASGSLAMKNPIRLIVQDGLRRKCLSAIVAAVEAD
jgi:hypothetical protein